MNFITGCFQPNADGQVHSNADTTPRQEGYLWFKDLGQHFAGEFSIAAVQANNLMEDSSQVFSGSLGDDATGPYGTFVGVYDGHGGPETARFLAEHLTVHLKRVAAERQTMSAQVIKNALQATEDNWHSLVASQWVMKPQMASVGSCCIVGVICSGILYVANLGDSRAVLGRQVTPKGKLLPIQLSTDQNVNIESIRHEMQARHPQDLQIVSMKNGSYRVKGIIQVTRSMGDVYLKNPEFNKPPLIPKFLVPESFEHPILSSEPEFFVARLQPQDRFIIFASDGFWGLLSNEDAVDIVNTNSRSGSAKKLVKAAMTVAGKKVNRKYNDVVKIPAGEYRRACHDDISVVVLFLDGHLLNRASSFKTPTISVKGGFMNQSASRSGGG